MQRQPLLTAIARAFLAGEPTEAAVYSRASRMLGRRWHWLRLVARRYVKAYAGHTRPQQQEVIRFIAEDHYLNLALIKYSDELRIDQWLTDTQPMQPVEATRGWKIPVIESAGELARWLLITPSELEWFAGLQGPGYIRGKSHRLQHYHYRIFQKRSGNIRLIEAPKPRLKELQRQILTRILDKIPSHSAVHGFCQGRSTSSFVSAHVNQGIVLRMDIRDFFPSISGARVQAFFRTAGYPESVANLLGGICTNTPPREAWNLPASTIDSRQIWQARAFYAHPHLPQGAPTSPSLANLCSYRLDCRLAGLAKTAGASYTRYADDLAFSGNEEFARQVERFSTFASAILLEEGFNTNHRKTRIMRPGVRQHLAGLVVNQRINVKRSDFDRLKAILTNCRRLGPASQNRDLHPFFQSHLEGRVSFVESINPARGKRLRELLDRIEWQ